LTTRFRTLTKFPEPGTLAAARALLLELAPSIGAVPFDSWTSLATICETGWLPAARRPSAAQARVTRRRLRVLATAPLSFAAFARLQAGEGPVHVRGTCAPLSASDSDAPVWSVEAVAADAAQGPRQLVEQGSDFLLSLPDGQVVRVLAEGGHLVSADVLRIGDAVSVFGFADETADRAGLGPSPHGRGGLVRALRSGAELPLLVCPLPGRTIDVVR
jgi:hypothetical protein